MKKLLNFIDGRFCEPNGGRFFDSFDPSTGKAHLLVADSDASDVEAAVAAARRAFPSWAALSPAERSKALYRVAQIIERREDELARAESSDQGKPVWLAKSMDISRAALNFRFFAGAILHEQDSVTKPDAKTLNYVSRKPLGVAGLISPWNLPLYLLTWKIAPALAYGNTVVAKPSELTSLTASLLGEIFVEAGIPNGVVNLIFGTGPRAGAPLVAHPKVPIISFTGGTVTGRTIAQAAAPLFKKLSLELGGKNPNLVFADADLEEAVATTIRSSFLNQGEICLCGSRIYVERSIFDKFLDSFVAKTRALKVGDPSAQETFMGPLVSREHLAKVESYVAVARDENVTIACGGKRPQGLAAAFAGGYFFEPTILTGAREDSRLTQEEIFGPVVTVTPFDSEDDAVGSANCTSYGLSATVWTKSLERAHRVADKLDAGTVWVNTWLARDLRMPFGGVKASGMGREGQEHSRELFTEAKTVCLRHG